jgi:hypothetical protein
VDIARLPDHNGERVHVLRPMNVDKVLQVFRADLEDDPTAKKEN